MLKHGSARAKESAAAGIAQMARETTISQPFHPVNLRLSDDACTCNHSSMTCVSSVLLVSDTKYYQRDRLWCHRPRSRFVTRAFALASLRSSSAYCPVFPSRARPRRSCMLCVPLARSPRTTQVQSSTTGTLSPFARQAQLRRRCYSSARSKKHYRCGCFMLIDL